MCTQSRSKELITHNNCSKCWHTNSNIMNLKQLTLETNCQWFKQHPPNCYMFIGCAGTIRKITLHATSSSPSESGAYKGNTHVTIPTKILEHANHWNGMGMTWCMTWHPLSLMPDMLVGGPSMLGHSTHVQTLMKRNLQSLTRRICALRSWITIICIIHAVPVPVMVINQTSWYLAPIGKFIIQHVCATKIMFMSWVNTRNHVIPIH